MEFACLVLGFWGERWGCSVMDV